MSHSRRTPDSTSTGAVDLPRHWTETCVDAGHVEANGRTLRLLATLLLRSAATAEAAPSADPEIPLDVVPPPKVGSDRE